MPAILAPAITIKLAVTPPIERKKKVRATRISPYIIGANRSASCCPTSLKELVITVTPLTCMVNCGYFCRYSLSNSPPNCPTSWYDRSRLSRCFACVARSAELSTSGGNSRFTLSRLVVPSAEISRWNNCFSANTVLRICLILSAFRVVGSKTISSTSKSSPLALVC